MKKRLAEFFKNTWCELLLLTLTVSFALQMYLFAEKRPEGSLLQSVALISIVAHAIGIYFVFRRLWRKKWRHAVALGMQKVFGRLQSVLERFADKIGIKKSKNSVLSGKTTVRFDKSFGEKSGERARAVRPPKWKQMSDERGRMRYLYRGMITNKIRSGESVYSFNTPSELSKTHGKTDSERGLFDMYIRCRYDERQSPDAKDVVRLKDELNIG